MISSGFDPVRTLYSNTVFDLLVERNRADNSLVLVKKYLHTNEKRSDGQPGNVVTQELEILGCLDHPNIASPITTIVNKESNAIIYPYNGSESLGKLISDGVRFEIKDAVAMMVQLLDALEYLHSHGLVVCNIHPGMIVTGDKCRLEIIDLCSAAYESELDFIYDGAIVGTFPYLSPEQTGFTEFKIDSRSDLYCVALLLYQLLSGKFPFANDGDNLEVLLNSTLKTEIQPLKHIPGFLNEIILKALRLTPSERYQSAAGFRIDLKEALSQIETGSDLPLVIGEKDSEIAINRTRFFVGRDLELWMLESGFDQLKRGDVNSYLLLGVNGIGKTEIVNTFKGKMRSKVAFVTIKCSRFTPNQPFSAMHQIVESALFAIEKSNSENLDELRKIINEQLCEDSGYVCNLFPPLRRLFDKVTYSGNVENEAERSNHLMLKVLEIILGVVPSVLFIDDLQWIDSVSFDILMKINKHNIKCMCIYTLRVDSNDNVMHLYNMPIKKIADRIINVMPFRKDDINAYVHRLFDTVEAVSELTDVLMEKSGGNPLIIKEIIAYFAANGFIRHGASSWVYDLSKTAEIPDKFDTVSLIMYKYTTLSADEQKFLQICSLMSGVLERKIIRDAGMFTPEESEKTFRNLEQIGFLTRNLTGDYNFTHDKIQETIFNELDTESRRVLSELVTAEYEKMAIRDKKYLFSAAECSLRTSKYEKSLELSMNAADYAVEKNAYDAAIRQFRSCLQLLEQMRKNGTILPVQVYEIEIRLGDVLLMTGRNEQALNIYKRLTEDGTVTDLLTQMEIRYKTGCIYHNTGNYEQSIPLFIDTLKKLKCRYPENRNGLLMGIFAELVTHVFHKLVPSAPMRKKLPFELLKIRILNKMAFSYFFDNVLQCLYANIKAVNLASHLGNCAEKAESFALCGVPAFQLLLKRMSRRYIHKAFTIANIVLRRDITAFSELFNGIVSYLNAQWQSAEKSFRASMAGFRAIGDLSSQLLSAEHLWRIFILRGEFSKARNQIEATIRLCHEASDRHFIFTTTAAEYYLDILQGKNTDRSKTDELDNRLNIESSPQSHTQAAAFLILADILQNNYSSAEIRLSLLDDKLKKAGMKTEYMLPLVIVKCELILRQLINKELTKQKEKEACRRLMKYRILLAMYSQCYPSYRGKIARINARLSIYKGKNHRAELFLRKAVNEFHKLDMKYEKACTLKELGEYYEAIQSPGLARDLYNDAYNLFESCDAVLECKRLRNIVSPSTVKHMLELSESESLQKQKENSNQIRFDTLLEMSSSMTQINDLTMLLEQVLTSLINATGAQYGCVLLKDENGQLKMMLLRDFNRNDLRLDDVFVSQAVIDKTEAEKKLFLYKGYDTATVKNPADFDEVRGKSILCTPLLRDNNFLGCVYLGNDKVAGLFSENAIKITQILSAQASVLIENSLLLQKYVLLNLDLDRKIKEQTKDLLDKKRQLETANLKLVDSERMKGILSGSLVHDIKNYAAGIEGSVQILNRRVAQDDPKVHRVLDVIGETCTDIVSLASNMLDIAKMDDGKLVVKQEKLTIEYAMGLAEKFFANPLFDEKGIVPGIVTSDKNWSVYADTYLLERIFQNIFSNAAKYAPHNGRLELSFIQNDNNSEIWFYNSGTPIPEKECEMLFEKYARIDNKQSQYSKGLGLFFCRMVMLGHKGKIWVETDEYGNYFKLSFPHPHLVYPKQLDTQNHFSPELISLEK